MRPTTRGDCPKHRPCPWVSCRHNLSIDIERDGLAVKEHRINGSNCSLDHADAGGLTVEAVAKLYGCTKQNIDLIFRRAVPALAKRMARVGITVEDLAELIRSKHRSQLGMWPENTVYDYREGCKVCGEKISRNVTGLCRSCNHRIYRQKAKERQQNTPPPLCTVCGEPVAYETKTGSCRSCSRRARAAQKRDACTA